MIIQIDPESDIPIYTQLTNQIIEGIVRGYIHQGASLPSVRAFAADLGVNMHTVNKSYHELEKKGIIEIVPKSGAVIRSINQVVQGTPNYERLSDQFRPVIAEALVLGMEGNEVEKLVQELIRDFKGN